MTTLTGDAHWTKSHAVLLTLLWVGSLFAAYLCLPRILLWIPEGRSKWITGVRSLAQSPPSSLKDFYECWLLTVLNWIVKLLVFGWIIELFSGQSYVNSLAGAIGAELSGILPIQGLAAFGTYEAGVLLAMTALGGSAHDALAGTFNLHLFILGTSLLGAYPTILFRRKRDRRRWRPLPRGSAT